MISSAAGDRDKLARLQRAAVKSTLLSKYRSVRLGIFHAYTVACHDLGESVRLASMSGKTEEPKHPEQIDQAHRWWRFLRRQVAQPDRSTVLAIGAGFVLAICSFPAGKIAGVLEWPSIRPNWIPNWMWWRMLVAMCAIAIALISLRIKKRKDDRIVQLIRANHAFGKLAVVSIAIARNTDRRCSITCLIRYQGKEPPPVIYMGTEVDGQQHQLTYDPQNEIYEGGTDATAFDEAIKRTMDIDKVGNGPRFFNAFVSTRSDVNIVGASLDKSLPIIAYYQTDPLADAI